MRKKSKKQKKKKKKIHHHGEISSAGEDCCSRHRNSSLSLLINNGTKYASHVFVLILLIISKSILTKPNLNTLLQNGSCTDFDIDPVKFSRVSEESVVQASAGPEIRVLESDN